MALGVWEFEVQGFGGVWGLRVFRVEGVEPVGLRA